MIASATSPESTKRHDEDIAGARSAFEPSSKSDAFLKAARMIVRQCEAVFGAEAGFVAWNTMLKKYGTVSLHSFIFIMPIAGVALGGLVLGEPITVKILLALAFIVSGILVVHWHPRKEAPAYPIRRVI